VDSFYAYYNKRSKDELIEKLRLLFKSRSDLEDKLAEVLGYPFDFEYGWAIGDHTLESLVGELIRRRSDALS